MNGSRWEKGKIVTVSSVHYVIHGIRFVNNVQWLNLSLYKFLGSHYSMTFISPISHAVCSISTQKVENAVQVTKTLHNV